MILTNLCLGSRGTGGSRGTPPRIGVVVVGSGGGGGGNGVTDVVGVAGITIIIIRPLRNVATLRIPSSVLFDTYLHIIGAVMAT